MFRFQMALIFQASVFCFIICGPIQDVEGWFPFGSSDPDMENVYIDSKLKCDSCTALAYQIKTKFDKTAQDKPSVKLDEPHAREIVESVCNKDFKEFDAVTVKGRDRLTGPGLPEQIGDPPEITPEQWRFNLRDMCRKYGGQLGELKIYETYYKDPSGLKEYMCNGDGIRDTCTMVAKEDSIYPGGFMYDDFFMPDEL